jgi:putative ABC transport system permease protein
MMALGAIFGALNTMYSAVSARTREIATLRALGFGSGPVVLSILLESLALALVGGAFGAAVAYLAFNDFKTSTINWQTFSQIAFAFKVTPSLLVSGVTWAVVIGLVGGLFPAIRAARLPIAAALREL